MTPQQFISKMLLHFKLHVDGSNEQAEWIADATEAVKGYLPEVLATAAKAIIRDRESPWFPTIGECRHACSVAAIRLAPARPIDAQQDAWPEPTEEQKAVVNEMVAKFKKAMAEKSLPPIHSQLTERSRRMMGDDA